MSYVIYEDMFLFVSSNRLSLILGKQFVTFSVRVILHIELVVEGCRALSIVPLFCR